MDRTTGGFWWVWREGTEWPSWYYSESLARDAVKRLAYGAPGCWVHIGRLDVVDTIMLPDKLVSV